MINALILTTMAVVSQGASPNHLAHIKVDGEGYLRFAKEGRIIFAKEAKLASVSGILCHTEGPKVMPEIQVPSYVKTLKISLDGTVTGFNGSQKLVLGRLVLGFSPSGNRLSAQGSFELSVEKMSVGHPSDDLLGVILDFTPKRVLGEGVERVDVNTQPFPKESIASKPAAGPEKTEPKAPSKQPVTPPIPAKVAVKQTVLAVSTDSKLAGIPIGEKVTFKPNFETDSDKIYVRDVIATRVETMDEAYLNVVVETTPTFGAIRRVDGFRLRTAFGIARLDTKKLIFDASSCAVKRASQSLAQSEFMDAAMTKIWSVYGSDVKGTTSVNLPAMVLPKGDTRFEVTLGLLSNSKVPATVNVIMNGNRYNSRTFMIDLTGLPAMPRVGSMITVITRVSGVKVETRGKVINVDITSRSATVETDEKVRLTGKVLNETTLEVKL